MIGNKADTGRSSEPDGGIKLMNLIVMKYMLILLISSIFLNSCVFNCASYLDNNIKPYALKGILISKQKAETGCFGILILKNQNKSDTLRNICYCVPASQGLWKYMEEGDSLYKAAESLNVEVYRKGAIKKFEYPCCSQ